MFHYDQEIFKNKQVEKANFLMTGVYNLVHDLAKNEADEEMRSFSIFPKDYFLFFSYMSLLKDMLHNAVHIGSDAKHWSPAMKPYIHGTQNGIHVFDLTKTEAHLAETKKALEEFCKSGNELLIVGTKIQTQKIAVDLAEKTGHSSVTSVWVP